jgi:hypothetical protein
MLDLNKKWVADTVTQNPYFDRCNRQALVVRDLQDKVQLLLQKRKCTHEVAIQIRVAKQKYHELEQRFFSMHNAKVAMAHKMEKKKWQDK